MSAPASCGHNAKSGFVSTVPTADVSRCSDILLGGFLGRLALHHSSAGRGGKQRKMTDPPRMADRIGHGRSRPLSYSDQRELVDAGGVDHCFEILEVQVRS